MKGLENASGAKAPSLFEGVFGTTEVVPFQNRRSGQAA